jgi:hypothetical protein
MKYVIKEFKILRLIFFSVTIILMILSHINFINQSTIYRNVYRITNNGLELDSMQLVKSKQKHIENQFQKY